MGEHSDFSVSRGVLLVYLFVLLSNLEVTACAPIQVWLPILNNPIKRVKLKMESIKRRFIQWPPWEEEGRDPADLLSLFLGPDVRSKFKQRAKDVPT